MNGPQISMLPDGRRFHLNHGPIDLIVEAVGDGGEVSAAYGQAARRFDTVLSELVAELPGLRGAASATPRRFDHVTARRMEQAVAPLAEQGFVTPMAAVAGAVADEVLAALVAGRVLAKAYVNNGGDIAFYLSPGATMRAAIGGTGDGDRITIAHEDLVRGIATSGWRGRSHSLGIADSVSVLARSAASADAAATLIANAVDLPGHPAVARRPARELSPDSDLGDRPVTVGVGALGEAEISQALRRGRAVASVLAEDRRIEAAALFLNGRSIMIDKSRRAPFRLGGDNVRQDRRGYGAYEVQRASTGATANA